MTTPHVRALGIAVLCVCCCVQTTAGADDIWDLPPLTADPEAILELAASVPVDDGNGAGFTHSHILDRPTDRMIKPATFNPLG